MLVLPTFYYRDHFAEMLSFVERVYGPVLDASHRAFIALYRSLSDAEQCLYVRMTNRKGRIFPHAALVYPEIADIPGVIETLRERGLVRSPGEGDYAAWLNLLRKDDLAVLARDTDMKPSWSKPRMVEYILNNLPFAQAAQTLDPSCYVVQEHTDRVEFLLYLYFGKTFADLKSFALRDLGLVHVNGNDDFTARFDDMDDAASHFHYHQILRRLDAGADRDAEMAALLEGPEGAPELKSRAAFTIGSWFEKSGVPEKAMAAYRYAPSAESNERLVRMLYANGARLEARELLERMIDDPHTDDEYTFASDFHARKFEGGRISATTHLLRAAQEVMIDDIHRAAPEAGMLSYFARQGWRAAHSENVLWHEIFGLLFWPYLFEGRALASGFDRLPRSLKTRTFAQTQGVAEIIDTVRSGRAMPVILRNFAAHHDKPNGLFGWEWLDMDLIGDFIAHADPKALAAVLELMAADYHAMRDGFPDLVLIRDGQVRFVEIKAQGDAVRRNQMTRLRQLKAAGFEADLCRVAYRYDPEQVYVIVDIETTGGRSDHDRVTEIAAVKMRGDEVLDEFQTLVYPQRLIPAYITQLTGISNEMVREAPLFSDIADDFAAFMEGAIFVAHNVNFDYGFIAGEFARMDRRFSYPKFCTVAGMRRHYPGHASYSLANMCAQFGIDLEDHHRALCDARASARLLSLINKRRAA